MKSLRIIFPIVLLLYSCGCNPSIIINAEGLGDASTEVNMIGDNQSKLNFWKNISMDEYWQPGNKTRLSVKESGQGYTMAFRQTESREMILKTGDPVWKDWKNRKSKYLIVLVDLHRMFINESETGSYDPRRLIIPFKCFKRKRKVIININQSSISCPSLPKCEFIE